MEKCPECGALTDQLGKYAFSFLCPNGHTFEIRIYTGDIFIHKRTGLEYVFYHENLGTRIERAKR